MSVQNGLENILLSCEREAREGKEYKPKYKGQRKNIKKIQNEWNKEGKRKREWEAVRRRDGEEVGGGGGQ